MDAKLYTFKAKQLRNERKFREAQELLEKGLKEYPKNIFIINGLISTYGTYQFDEAKKLFEVAVKLNLANKITYNSMLNIYVKKRDLSSAKLLFERMENKNLVDEAGYNTMLNLYVQVKDVSSAKDLFEKMEHKNLVDEVSYNTMLQAYYVTKRYGEGLSLISKAPIEFRSDLIFNINEIEFNRKLKNYDLCLDLISNVSKNFTLSEESKIALQTIRAYCFKEMNRTNDAVSLLRNLLKTTNENDPSYFRIVSGLVFCDSVKPHEIEKFTNILLKADKNEFGNNEDVSIALNKLSRKGNEYKVKDISNNLSKNTSKELNLNKN